MIPLNEITLPGAMVGVEIVHVVRHAGALAGVVGDVVVID